MIVSRASTTLGFMLDASISVISIREARKRYGRTQALASMEWETQTGEHLGLLGALGSGKLTLLRSTMLKVTVIDMFSA